MKELTINDLAKLIKAEIKKGNGDKKILISDDEEGNGYHQLFYGFCPAKDEHEELDFFTSNYLLKPFGVTDENVSDYIILG